MYLLLSLLILAAGLLLLFLPRRLAPGGVGGAVLISLRFLGLGLAVAAALLIRGLVLGRVMLPLW